MLMVSWRIGIIPIAIMIPNTPITSMDNNFTAISLGTLTRTIDRTTLGIMG